VKRKILKIIFPVTVLPRPLAVTREGGKLKKRVGDREGEQVLRKRFFC